MKNNLLRWSVLILFSFLMGACNKSTNHVDSSATEQEFNELRNFSEPKEGKLRIFTVKLHRENGVDKDNKACVCDRCFGLCDFEWFPDSKISIAEATVALDKRDNNTSTLYFLKPIENDNGVDVFYVDQDVIIYNDDGSSFLILQDEYPLIEENGILIIDGAEVNYYGKIIANN